MATIEQPEVLGYIILTRQPDGSWRDDWDGLVHATVDELRKAVWTAQVACGEDQVKAVQLTEFEGW